MPAPRRTVSLLAALLGTALLAAAAPEAHAAGRRATARPAQGPTPDLGAEAEPAPLRSRKPPATPPLPAAADPRVKQPVPKTSKPERDKNAAVKPATADKPADRPADKHANKPTDKPGTTAVAAPRSQPTGKPADKPVTAVATPRSKPAARPLRPRREPLLARHPAASCALDPLEAVGLGQHGRARDSLREFYWSDMARFFESSVDMAEPVPQQVVDPAFLATDTVLRELPAAVRTPLAAVASARVVDRLGEREFNKVSKLLASLSPAHVAGLLRADSPTLRAYVWTWLSTTKTGGCHLGHLDLEFIEAAVADRSVAVEHGDDLVYRSLGDYALAARARLATLDPARFDAFLVRLTAAGEIDPLARATAHGILLRRGHWDTLAVGLRDASPPVRAATAAAAIEMNRDKVEPDMLSHAASDPADLVTEQIVGALLGVHDPHTHGRPQLRGLVASAKDERITATVARWRGHGDASEPLPAPARELRFVAVPVPADMPPAPVPEASQPVLEASQPVPEASRPLADNTPSAAPRERQRPLPGVLDDDSDDTGDPDELDHPSSARP